MAVAAQTKNPENGKAMGSILKIISGGKVLSITDISGNRFGLKVM